MFKGCRIIKRAFSTAFKNWWNLPLSVFITAVSLLILYLLGWFEQVAWELRLLILFLIILVFIYLIIFTWFIVKQPSPNRGDANFLISWKDAEVISRESYGLPLSQSNMRWGKVGTYIETNYETSIISLVLALKGKRYVAYGWETTTTQRIGPNPRYYHFQIPNLLI